ncbi:MAG: proline--tRNA ligase [Candidatus Aenigmatarchaeota archaeon]
MSQEEQTAGLAYKKSNLSDWYNDVTVKAGLADYSSISGCMVIRPHAYHMWENIQRYFDSRIKAIGYENAYFPIFIPERFLHKEKEHFEGFNPEVAYIERKDENEERYALRPTSETIMYDSYSKWIRSWRDLPLLINQWANIVRWEVKATRLFLRTREFLWQEGHTAHETKEQADNEVMKILKIYTDLIVDEFAIPIITGHRPETDKFPGALYTIAMEALMPDGKALQMGTLHNLGQNFSKPFDIKYKDKNEKDQYVWQTSWGVSTRMIGAMVMIHGDDKGLILPPKISPTQVVIIPIIFEKEKAKILKEAEKLKEHLAEKFSVRLDDRDGYSAGWKFNEWEMKGIPLRIELGPKDIKANQVVVVRRDTGEKKIIKVSKQLDKHISEILDDIQKNLYKRANKLLHDNISPAKNFSELKDLIKNRKMVKAGWCGDAKCEDKLQEETAATIRLIPLKKETPQGKCVICSSKKSEHVVYISKAY